MTVDSKRIVFAAIEELRVLCEDIQNLIEQQPASKTNRALGVALRRLMKSFRCVSHDDQELNGWLIDEHKMREAEAILREFGPESIGEVLAGRARDARTQFKKYNPRGCVLFRSTRGGGNTYHAKKTLNKAKGQEQEV